MVRRPPSSRVRPLGGGLETHDDVLRLAPALPPGLPDLRMELRYRGHWGLRIHVSHAGVRIGLPASTQPPIRVAIADGPPTVLAAGQTLWFGSEAEGR